MTDICPPHWLQRRPATVRIAARVALVALAAMLGGLGKRRVLVHCQINLRASSMVFLNRTIVLKDDPRTAYATLAGVWSPDGPWRRLLESQLQKHNIAFELL